MQGNEVVDALVLRGARGVGDRGFRLLVDAFGSARAVLAAPPAAVRSACGASEELIRALGQAPASWAAAAEEVRRATAAGFTLIPCGGPGYPSLLAQIPDPPAVLHLTGSLEPAHEFSVVVLGSRLSLDLAAAEVTVVSGLAQGIDAAAHQGALEGGGRTLAVFGAGLDVIYPGWNAELAAAVRRSGAWLSELPLESEPRPHHFPRRNRIISGLTRGVVVVEAAERSGSLITARSALDQGREVFAVPGLPGAFNSRGAHGLLREGAKLVECAEDVLVELRPTSGRVGRPAAERPGAEGGSGPTGSARLLWEALEDQPLHIDELAAKAGFAPAAAAAGLMELALEGHAEEFPGKRYARCRTQG